MLKPKYQATNPVDSLLSVAYKYSNWCRTAVNVSLLLCPTTSDIIHSSLLITPTYMYMYMFVCTISVDITHVYF